MKRKTRRKTRKWKMRKMRKGQDLILIFSIKEGKKWKKRHIVGKWYEMIDGLGTWLR